MLVFLGLLVGVGGYSAARADDSSARVLGFAIAGLFAIPLVMLLFRLPRMLSPRSVILNPAGLAIRHGQDQVVLPWPQLVAVGFGYEQAVPAGRRAVPTLGGPQEIATDYLAGKAQEALQVSDKRRIAMEIYPARPDAAAWFPKLQPYWQQQLYPPRAGLPPFGWRFPLPPVVSIAQAIDQGIGTFQPNRRLGWYARPWSGS